MKKPLNKEGRKPWTKTPKIKCFVTPCVQEHKHRRIAFEEAVYQEKQEAAKYAKLLTKRMKEAKEKHPGADCQETEAVLFESYF